MYACVPLIGPVPSELLELELGIIFKLPRGCWKFSSSLLGEWPVLSITEPPLQSP